MASCEVSNRRLVRGELALVGGDIAAPPVTIRILESVERAEDWRLYSEWAGPGDNGGCGLPAESLMDGRVKTRGSDDGLIPIPELGVDRSVDRR